MRTIISTFTLECGTIMNDVPVAYRTWGQLSPNGDNVMVICHSSSDDVDVETWWSPLFGGHERAIDTTRYFVICMNSLGSPYGTASPCTDYSHGFRWGPDFPPTTIRDDVRLHKLLLDHLGIKQVAVVIGGSMGGMLVLEWAFFGAKYVRTIVPIATTAQTSAWCIAWGESQRQSIFSDGRYEHGYYPPHQQPRVGLAAARMSALLASRSRTYYETKANWAPTSVPEPQEKSSLVNTRDDLGVDTEGTNQLQRNGNTTSPLLSPVCRSRITLATQSTKHKTHSPPAVQRYLHDEAERFVSRFDANCYIALTRKIDTHDIARGRFKNSAAALAVLTQPALVIGIASDWLYPLVEQQELAEGLPYGQLIVIDTDVGHLGFMMQSDAAEMMNGAIIKFLRDFLEW
ncbi:homoserine O-acetyltransferase [Phlyctema vagabunda]|uniref:Homoserine O-acetyltransferase n=1 Tax=Phlyctema vagabunda TaxID=108571 RepID=A0ABR4P8A1_9HELO